MKNILILLIAAGTVWAAPRWPNIWDSAYPSILRPERSRVPAALDEDSLHVYDALKYECRLNLDFGNTEISGFVTLQIVADEQALDCVDLRFTQSLTIDSVWTDRDDVTATHTTNGMDSLQIRLVPALSLGDTVGIGIAYHGDPDPIDDWGGFRWAQPLSWHPEIAFSLGDGFALDPPPSNYNWLPSYADPTDKVLWEAWFRVPENRVVSTGGLRIDTTHHGDGTVTWHYRLDHPVSTYLLFVAASDYIIMTQRESGPLIENFVYPSRQSEAETHFSNVPTVLDGFVELFGPYPFERFGYCMARLGDMEHATCVTHDDRTVLPNHTYDWLLFHEMSHQWWGDWVTCGDWRDLWINEGFATYCEALAMEILYGHQSYSEYVVQNIFAPALSTSEFFPIYDPAYYWGATVYEKGASVMHMLRCLLGDSAFFAAWREFGQEHAFGNAVTADWQAKLEEHYGDSLDWFFQPWVYGVRYPQYQVTLEISDIAELTIEQTQATSTLFRMPIDVQMISYGDDTVRFTLWNDATASQTWRIDSLGIHSIQRSMLIDPDNKILKTATYRTVVAADNPPSELPTMFRITSISPNPFNPAALIRFDLPYTSAVRFQVFDLLGRSVAEMNLGTLSAGTHGIAWDGSYAASGLYLFSLETPQEIRIAKAVLLK